MGGQGRKIKHEPSGASGLVCADALEIFNLID